MHNLIPLTSVADIDGEPRIMDTMLAVRLGYTRPADIRELIARNRDELEAYGNFPYRTEKSDGRGRPGKAYWLNEGQALVLCALSKTKAAAAVRKALIEVFMAYRQGKLVHVKEHRRKLPQKAQGRGVDPCDMDAQRAFVRAFLAQRDGLETLLAGCLVQIGELRKA